MVNNDRDLSEQIARENATKQYSERLEQEDGKQNQTNFIASVVRAIIFHGNQARKPDKTCCVLLNESNWTLRQSVYQTDLNRIQIEDADVKDDVKMAWHTAICIQAQTANIFARFFTFETGCLPLETEMYSPLM